MNSKSKVDFPMIKNNDFLICLYIIYYIYCILYVCHRIIRGPRAISVFFFSDARKNRRYKFKTKTKTYLKRKISEF